MSKSNKIFPGRKIRGLIGRSYDDDATQKDKKVLPYKARLEGRERDVPLAVVLLCVFFLCVCVCVKLLIQVGRKGNMV